ncbi:glycogen/starch/alpha-glucan phosphorylase [Zongyangia hominis]|uniref:Alpha-1,4 glucan phosphorylase n=1 Tax=Zongyangia hominis TaxID=2763677 RepID=A0A926EEL1_9FIRM|nr:glycogen/starch/alpha-glucan phosphorylase [Zongyangia hominis]MBC8570461.1 glycogen/starch/alpha-glucan phosphorylase [Zongyangia hominis]
MLDTKRIAADVKRDIELWRVQGEDISGELLNFLLSKAIMRELIPLHEATVEKQRKVKNAYYFSAEYLMGRMIQNNLMNLGLHDELKEEMKAVGINLDQLEEVEDAGLGNGGLGRLAACFLDSGATLGLPLNGYGLRYRYGLFRQQFEDGFQKELADNWLKHPDPWSIRRDDRTCTVELEGKRVLAVPYDMPVIGYHNDTINSLRLWQCEAIEDFNFEKFNNYEYDEAVAEKNYAENITRVLYPNDSTDEGRSLRIKQEYFLSSASLQDIIRTHKENGRTMASFPTYNAIQLNDTHPVFSIPELTRILIDEEGVSFQNALDIVRKTFGYTNHTIMAEALEKWDAKLVKEIVPRVYEIIERIDQQLRKDLAAAGRGEEKIEEMAILRDKKVYMAHLAIYLSHSVNGVAKIHTEILKKRELSDWYALYPERFQNKTNGITQRRWLRLCNPHLSDYITKLLGDEGWVTDLDRLTELKQDAADPAVLAAFRDIKRINKQRLCDMIWEKEGVKLSPDFLFDIQVKRLHEYKRQFLNALAILDIYFCLKDGAITGFTPTVYFFGAKAAPGYDRAKAIIKFINEVAKRINNDPEMKDLLKVVFVTNYDVSYGERLFPAADVSEQISTAGTEASGTGNMKFMLNGAVTLGTYDGANVEIVEAAGMENNYIFGARVEELEALDHYDPVALYEGNVRIKRVVDTLIDGTFDDGDTGMFQELYDSLLKGASWHDPDQYKLLYDLPSYVAAKLKVNRDYADREKFSFKCWMNMASAGRFSSDRTIREYAKDIWDIAPVEE